MYNNDDYTANPADKNDKITCLCCGKKYHQLSVHLKSHDMNVAEYNEKFPGAPTISAYASANVSKAQSKQKSSFTSVTPPYASPAPAAAVHSHAATVLPMPSAPSNRHHVDNMSFGPVKLPVLGGLSAAEQAAVPACDENYQVDEKFLTYLAVGISQYENVLISGPTGSGKTTGVMMLCSTLNRPVTRINLNGDSRASDLVGDMSVKIDESTGQAYTEWEDGPVVTAMREGHVLVLDEIDATSPSVHFVLQALAERHHNPEAAIANGQAHCKLVLPTGEQVGAHPDLRLIATANTVGTGDLTGDYAATNILNGAFLDRWGVKIRVEYPEAKKWKAILISKTGVTAPEADCIVKVAMLVNEGKSTGTCRVGFSPRKTLTWARLFKLLGDYRTSANLSILNGIDSMDPDQQFVSDIIANVTGEMES